MMRYNTICTNWVKFYQIYSLNPFLIILNHSEMHSVPKMDENIKFKARVNQFSKSWLCQKTIQFCARIQFTAMKLNNYCSLTFSLYLQLTTQYLSRVVGRSENLRGGIGKGEWNYIVTILNAVTRIFFKFLFSFACKMWKAMTSAFYFTNTSPWIFWPNLLCSFYIL